MRMIFITLIGIVVAMTSTANSQPASEEQAVRSVITGFEEAWNKHDMDAMASLFTNDAEWVAAVGWWWRGLPEVKRGFVAIHATMFKNTPFHADSVSIRFPTPDTAIAIVTGNTGSFVAPDGTRVAGKKDRLSIFMVKHKGHWLIASGQNTAIVPEAQQYDPIPRE
jgi:uncharacterized protein (TIGR02246 family)